MPLPPSLSPEQRQAALEKATAARRQRAEVKERLKAGALSLEPLLQEGDEDETLAKLKVVSVLESMPGVGKVGARRLMEELDISESRRLRGLGDNQRKELLQRFPCAPSQSSPVPRAGARARSSSAGSSASRDSGSRCRPTPANRA